MLDREEDRYANTPGTELFLDRAKPSYRGDRLETENERMYDLWGSLTDSADSARTIIAREYFREVATY
jgi:hypothetical protein